MKKEAKDPGGEAAREPSRLGKIKLIQLKVKADNIKLSGAKIKEKIKKRIFLNIKATNQTEKNFFTDKLGRTTLK